MMPAVMRVLRLPTALASRQRLWLLAGLALLGWRMVVVAASQSGLHVDEAQYWVWSQSLDWGYFSKPPVIAGLIAAGTGAWGDSVLAIRLLPMLCWVAASGVLAVLASRMGHAHVSAWTAALFASTSASGLLGLVATTDGPLVLAWALTMALTWEACDAQDRRAALVALGWWAGAGLALGLAVQSKYTGLALGLSWAWLAFQRPQRVPGMALGLLLALAVVLPNLLWNAQHGWPTLAHTLDITAQATGVKVHGGWLDKLLAVGTYAGGQLLLAGPALMGVVWWALRQGSAVSPFPLGTDKPSTGNTSQVIRWAMVFVWPLLLLGLLQAWNASTQMNWTAPALLGGSLAAGLWLGSRPHRWRWARWLVVCGLVLGTLIGLGDLRAWAPGMSLPEKVKLNFWHKTLGWTQVLQALTPAVKAHPTLDIISPHRDVLAQATYAWRDLGRHVLSWNPGSVARHHFDLAVPFSSQHPGPVLYLDRAPPPPALVLRYPTQRLLVVATHGDLTLQLWLMEPV